MKFLSKLFKRSSIECPRCLGKGYVDETDIRRLQKQLLWTPGSCAYCNGTGSVSKETIHHLPPDTTYLTTDLPEKERNDLMAQKTESMDRAGLFEKEAHRVIRQIEQLHFSEHLDVSQILQYFLKKEKSYSGEEVKEMEGYIQKVIARHKTGD